jgi:hypothetical protein
MRGAAVISTDDSPVEVRVVPPAEDLMIVNHVAHMLSDDTGFDTSFENVARDNEELEPAGAATCSKR